jgi:hypothetical protein
MSRIRQWVAKIDCQRLRREKDACEMVEVSVEGWE